MINPLILDQLTNQAMKALDAGQLETARQLFEDVLAKANAYPPFAVGAAYSVAAFHWGEYGNGIEAKAKYQFVISAGKALLPSASSKTASGIKVQMSYAAENLMLLSTSYDEFDTWAKELRELAPNEPILKELVPVVHADRDKGVPWAEEMFQRGSSYVNWGHFGSAMHPSSGACIFHLMLANRKVLRMQPDVWQKAIMGYNATVYEIGYKAEKLIRARHGRLGPELMGVAQFLVPLTKEYCEAQPSDEKAAQLLANAMKLADQYASSTTSSPSAAAGSPLPRTVAAAGVSPLDKVAGPAGFILILGFFQELLGWLAAGQPFLKTALVVVLGCMVIPSIGFSRLRSAKPLARYAMWIIMVLVVAATSPWGTGCIAMSSTVVKGISLFLSGLQMFCLLLATRSLASQDLAHYLAARDDA